MSLGNCTEYGPVAQRIEQFPSKEEVAGSIPAWVTKACPVTSGASFTGSRSSMVEQRPLKAMVGGSSPPGITNLEIFSFFPLLLPILSQILYFLAGLLQIQAQYPIFYLLPLYSPSR